MTCVQTTRIRRLYFLCEYRAFQIFFLMGLEVRGNLEIGKNDVVVTAAMDMIRKEMDSVIWNLKDIFFAMMTV